MTKALEPNDQKSNMDEVLPEADGGFDFKEYLLALDEPSEEPQVSHDHHGGRPTDQPSEPKVESFNTVSSTSSTEPKTRVGRRRFETDIHDAVLSLEEKDNIPATDTKPQSREEKRKAEQSGDRKNKKMKRRLKVRLVPVWLRLLIILVLSQLKI